MIPNQIAWETHNLIPSHVLEDIMKGLAAVFNNEEKVACEGGEFRLYVTAETMPHLKIVKDLGLVKKKSTQKNKNKQLEDVYELTWKAWRWYALSVAMYGI